MIAFLLLAVAVAKAESQQGFEKIIRLDNDETYVVEMRFAPGAASPLHTHIYPGRVIYVLQAGTIEIVPQGGEAKRKALAAGTTIWRPAETHVIKNVGDTEFRVLEVEVKQAKKN